MADNLWLLMLLSFTGICIMILFLSALFTKDDILLLTLKKQRLCVSVPENIVKYVLKKLGTFSSYSNMSYCIPYLFDFNMIN